MRLIWEWDQTGFLGTTCCKNNSFLQTWDSLKEHFCIFPSRILYKKGIHLSDHRSILFFSLLLKRTTKVQIKKTGGGILPLSTYFSKNNVHIYMKHKRWPWIRWLWQMFCCKIFDSHAAEPPETTFFRKRNGLVTNFFFIYISMRSPMSRLRGKRLFLQLHSFGVERSFFNFFIDQIIRTNPF